MREEKKLIGSEYVARLNASPYCIVTDYQGLTVSRFSELRKRLRTAGAECHVVKNSIFRRAAMEAGLPDIGGSLAGQLAVVTGARDISMAAKTLKEFSTEFERPKVRFGYLKAQRLEAEDLKTLADLPPLDVLRGKTIGVLRAPASRLVGILNAPAGQLVRLLKAKAEKVAE